MTIGILTALPHEAAAMVSLLDDVDDFRDPQDPNHYRVGSLPSADPARPHVVAVLMMPRDGTRPAAYHCANMLRTFRGIQTVIMVGIAGGLPRPLDPERHVRLGDIVVAADGIVDYTHVRQSDGRAEPRSRQSGGLISHRLLRAARELQLDELNGICRWAVWLDPARTEQAAQFPRPPNDTDVLYVRGLQVAHPDRSGPAGRAGLPHVHYGVVGSGDVLLRDEQARDELAGQFPDMVAVEMEGSGIAASTAAEDRSWFMVRGVADYAEMHGKNDVWHPYASYVAAAYIRSLLEVTAAFAGPRKPVGGRLLPWIDEADQTWVEDLLRRLPAGVDLRREWHAVVPAEYPEPPPSTAANAFRRLVGLNADAAGLQPAIVLAGRLGQLAGDSPAGAELTDWAAGQAARTGVADALRARLDALGGSAMTGPTLVITVEVDGLDRGICRITPYLHDGPGPWNPRPGPGEPIDTLVAHLETVAAGLVAEAEIRWARSTGRAGIELIMSTGLLNLPVQWFSGPRLFDIAEPLGVRYAVSLRSLERLRERRVRREWALRWRHLDRKPSTAHVHWGVIADTPAEERAWAVELSGDDRYAAVVLSEPPTSERGRRELHAALAAGVPVVLWDQRPLRPEDSTHGIRLLLADPAALRERIRGVRMTAANRPEHFGRTVALMWDDPGRLLDDREAGS